MDGDLQANRPKEQILDVGTRVAFLLEHCRTGKKMSGTGVIDAIDDSQSEIVYAVKVSRSAHWRRGSWIRCRKSELTEVV